jgi:predicted dehydrogenase
MTDVDLNPAPRFPGRRLTIAILGAGRIAQTAHLPAYRAHGLDVVGAWSRSESTRKVLRGGFPWLSRVYDSADDLLGDPDVDIVDLATGPEQRAEWLGRAVDAGKHVLAQKPLTLEPESLLPVLDEADRRGIRIAVNQNGRWAPPWRVTTLLVEQGAIGDVVAITHLHDKPLPPLASTPFDKVPHMLVTDYFVHWLDITRCWLEGQRVHRVQADDHRVPGQPAQAANPWAASVRVETVEGADALVRVVGDVRTATAGCPFWVHGTTGTIRGSLLGRDFVELDADGKTRQLPLTGAWFVDGFAGAMGELMCAVVEDREPFNSARHNLATVHLVLAARASAQAGGAVQQLDEPL